MQTLATSFAALLLSRLAPISRLGSPAFLSSDLGSSTCSLPLFTYLGTLIAMLSPPVPALVLGSLVVLLPLPMFDPTPAYLAFTALRSFKCAFSDKFLRCSSSFAGLYYLFLLFGLLPNKNNCKWTFDTAFINLPLLASNHG